MTDIFVPCILNKTATLFKVKFEIDTICANGNAKKQWDFPPDIPNYKSASRDFEEIYGKVESYFNEMFINAVPGSIYFTPVNFDLLKGCDIELNYTNISMLLGVFLAAAKEIMDLKIKDCWHSITATGTFKDLDQDLNLLLAGIGDYKPDDSGRPDKFTGFKNYIQNDYTKEKECDTGKYNLYLYVNDDMSLEEMSDENICVKAFSPTKNTLFDILDCVFDLGLHFLPEHLNDAVKEKYFDVFKEKTKKIKHVDFSIYHDKKTISDNLNNNPLFIYGPNGSGKSYLAIQIARYMVWNRTIYAPIWIKIDTLSLEDDKSRMPVEIREKLFLFFNEEDQVKCLVKLKERPFLIIIDSIPNQIIIRFLERMKDFIEDIGEKSRIIFISTDMYDSKMIKDIDLYPMPHDEKNIEKDAESHSIPAGSVSAEQVPALQSKKPFLSGSIIRNVLVGFAIFGLVFSLFFTFVYRPNKASDINNSEIWKPPSNPTELTVGQWVDGAITSIDGEEWYSFPITSGARYYIWLNDKKGDGTKTLNVKIDVFDSSGDFFSSEIDSSWDIARGFTARSTGTIYVRVYPSSQDNIGTYGIVYSTDLIRPGWKHPSNVISLTANQWEDGSITGSARETWYSFSVIRGTRYYFWYNGLADGDGTKTLEVRATLFYSNGELITDGTLFGWDTTRGFIAHSTGTIYVRVHPSSQGNIGTYGIMYSTDSIRPGWKPHSNVTILTANQWEDGNITNSVKEEWYSFPVISGTQYYLWLNDEYGDGTKTMDVRTSAFYSNGKYISDLSKYDSDSAWDRPMDFTASSTDTVYIRIRPPYLSGDTGTYAVVYSTNSISRPGWKPPSSAALLTANQWKNGNITGPVREDWLSFSVVRGTQYYLWLNDKYGDGTKTMDVRTSAFYSNGEYISGLFKYDSAWDRPMDFTASSTGTVYIRVYSTSPGDTGTYGIVYSANSIRPGWKPPSSAALLTANQWEDGNITNSVKEDWYSFPVTSGTRYYIWLNNLYEGDGTKTLNASTFAFYSSGEPIDDLSRSVYAWDRPMGFTASSTGTVYVKINSISSRNNTGTYGIVYSTNGRIRPNFKFPSDVTLLTANQWKDSNITILVKEEWYSFSVTSGVKYYLWLNDLYDGDGTNTLNAEVDAFYSNLDMIFSNSYFHWDRPRSFTASSTGTIYVKVSPSSEYDSGIYSIVYSTDRIRPGWQPSSDPTLLIPNQWKDGSITSSVREDWYSFTAISRTGYYIWWNDLYRGDGAKTLDVGVSAFYSNGEPIFSTYDSAWDSPKRFTASSTGTVYVRVFPYPGSNNNTGDYSVVYSTNITRP